MKVSRQAERAPTETPTSRSSAPDWKIGWKLSQGNRLGIQQSAAEKRTAPGHVDLSARARAKRLLQIIFFESCDILDNGKMRYA